ncbi:MAG: hypothetical protein A3K19_07015 [Lentisphaerae bacterium RIFOXYB12_FULL_65_16]|nr:MAG: hypothetical protein A3K18_12310 [Lentisphaerae bacterium RIFOXYA12_64_32]OGV93272.1 MAG: hypothetical protein A3K19_07015 [Lentisphaerae bacterium RIFOXYB12_FULL_65_16]
MRTGRWFGRALGITPLLVALAYGQDVSVPPALLDRAMAMFPKAAPPVQMSYRVDVRMNHLGFAVTNYAVTDANGDLGAVSRIQSFPGAVVPVDCLVLCDKDGRMLKASNLTPWKVNGRDVDVTGLLKVMAGYNMEELKQPLTVLCNGIALAAKSDAMEQLAKPPAGYTLDLEHKILMPGAKLPKITIPTLAGPPFDSAALGGAPLIVVFVSMYHSRSDEFVAMMEECRRLMAGNPAVGAAMKKVRVLYVAGGKPADVTAFAKSVHLAPELVAADATDTVQKLFQVPFKPYTLMFDNDGVLKFVTPDLKQDELFGMLYLLCGGDPEGKGADAAPAGAPDDGKGEK